jgi:tetratricopeptide (TPR) repeat protein
VVATWDGIDAARAEASFIRAYAIEQRLRNLDWQGTDAEYQQMVFAAREASERRPGNVHYAFWENVYQLKYLEAGRDDGDGPVQLLKSDLVLLRDRMDVVRRIAPTFGPAHSVAGEIRLRYLDEPLGGKLIRQGRRLNRTDPTSILLAAELSLKEKDYVAAIDDFRALSQISEGYRVEGVMLLLKASQVDAAMQLAEGSVPASSRLHAELSRTGPADAAHRARTQLRQELLRLADDAEAPGEALATLGRMLAEDGEHERSIEVMRRALRRNVAKSEWRLQVVQSLLELGRDSDALDEVQNVIRSDPRNRRASELLTQIEERLRRSRSGSTQPSDRAASR